MNFIFKYGFIFLLLLMSLSAIAQHSKKRGTKSVSGKTAAKSTRNTKSSSTGNSNGKTSSDQQNPSKQDNLQTDGDSKNSRWNSSACAANRKYFEFDTGKQIIFQGKAYTDAELYKSYTREKALNIRQTLMSDPSWKYQLPCCPETAKLAEKSPFFDHDSFLKTFFNKEFILSCFHPDADSDFRTSELYHTSSGSTSGQQCTYYKSGKLIPPTQPGAGTPDFYSPTVDQSNHLFYDVDPWTRLSLAEYNSVWEPDPGCDAPTIYTINSTRISNIWMYVNRGDIISINPSGTIKFDFEGNETGPEGSLVVPKTNMGMFGRIIAPVPFPLAKPGALLGGIFTGDLDSPNQAVTLDEDDLFYAGKAGDYKMPETGFLVLLVNDGYLENNVGSFKVNIYRKLAN